MAEITSPVKRSLSTKLLLLVIAFILLAEVVVMIPSVANQRLMWLDTRLEEAYLVSLALESPRAEMVGDDIARQLFSTANILGVTINEGDMRKLILAPQIDPHGPPEMLRVDLMSDMPANLITDAWATVFSSGDKLIQVTGRPRFAKNEMVDIIVSQRALRADLHIYARNILIISFIISCITAALVYWALNRMIVHPVKMLQDNMAAFEADPDNPERILKPSLRQDEIGAAEQSLAKMEKSIFELLNERRRLAALGAGISKISHDLRNILASAQLMSDRLAKSEDPRVRKLSPRLISALDRAIALSRDTLAFGKMEAASLQRAPFDISALIDEIFDDNAALGINMTNEIAAETKVVGDRTHLYRAIFNIVRNAVEAMTPDNDQELSDEEIGAITISSQNDETSFSILIADNGSGIPDYAREGLFEPFKGSKKPGGSGLGVAISAEIASAHGGKLSLEKSDETGTTFNLTIPSLAL